VNTTRNDTRYHTADIVNAYNGFITFLKAKLDDHEDYRLSVTHRYADPKRGITFRYWANAPEAGSYNDTKQIKSIGNGPWFVKNLHPNSNCSSLVILSPPKMMERLSPLHQLAMASVQNPVLPDVVAKQIIQGCWQLSNYYISRKGRYAGNWEVREIITRYIEEYVTTHSITIRLMPQIQTPPSKRRLTQAEKDERNASIFRNGSVSLSLRGKAWTIRSKTAELHEHWVQNYEQLKRFQEGMGDSSDPDVLATLNTVEFERRPSTLLRKMLEEAERMEQQFIRHCSEAKQEDK
jgi:hypothetical protein